MRRPVSHGGPLQAEWIFPWQRPVGGRLRKWGVLLGVTVAFALLAMVVRIRVAPPTPWNARRASVIELGDDPQGRELTLRAREEGPFPSRFDPDSWAGAAPLEQAAFAAIRWTPPYAPKLRPLEDPKPELNLAKPGKAVLPKRSPESVELPPAYKLRLAPEITPLAGGVELPRELPAFEGEMSEKLAAQSWEFLVRLNASGAVQDCVSLAGGDDAPPALEAWLRRIAFPADPKKSPRWIALAVDFANQPADGPDPR